MADNNTANVSVGKGVAGGYFFTAPTGTALPADYTAAKNAAFVNCGFLSDEGIVTTTNAENNDFRDLNGDDVLTATAAKTRNIQVQFIEQNAQALKEVYGQDNVTEANNLITVEHTNDDMPHRSIIMELVLRDGRKWRRVIPDAQVVDWDDFTVVSSELIRNSVTYKVNKGSDGKYIHDYMEPAPAASQGVSG